MAKKTNKNTAAKSAPKTTKRTPAPKKTQAKPKAPPPTRERITDEEVSKVISAASVLGGKSRGELVSELGLTPARAKRILDRAIIGGSLEMKGTTRSARYYRYGA